MNNPLFVRSPFKFLSLALASSALLWNTTGESHPYASGVTHIPITSTYSFILNESADDVKIAFDNGTVTTDLGALAKGSNSFNLGSHTNYSIIVSKAGSGLPSQISVDSALTTFHGPRGVAVNRNPKTHYFGRTYVANPTAGSDTARTTQKGVYTLNADQSDALGYGATAYPVTGTGAGQIQYGSSTTYAPYKISVGPDDSVYLGDASGPLSGGQTVGGGAWLLSPDLTNATGLFTYNGGTASPGLVCVAGTPTAVGSVGSNNLVLYTVEWNRTPYNNIWKYTMGSGPFPFTGTPTQLGNAGYPTVNQVLPDLAIGADGKYFVSENRSTATGSNVSVRVFAPDGVTQVWDSSSASGQNDPFVGSYGMALSVDGQYIATGSSAGNIDICKLTNGVPDLSTFSTIATGLSGIVYGVAWDLADNVYAVGGATGGSDLLRVYSLGLSTVTTTANDTNTSNGTFQIILQPTPPSIVTQPQSGYGTAGTTTTLSVVATGSTPLAYQWAYDGVNLANSSHISGATTATLLISNTVSTDAGYYQVVVTNALGTVTSAVANVTFLAAGAPTPGWSQFANSPGVNTVRHDDVSFTDPTNGWASQNNNIFRTTNGGATWTTNLVLGGTHFRSVAFATPLIGFGGNLGVGSYDGNVTNTNVLYKSVDGGVTWTNVPGFAEAGMKGLCSIFVLDSQHIYGAGRVRGPAYFIKSVDGGNTWSISSLTASNVMNGIMDIYFMDPTNGWVVGMDTNSYSVPPYYGRIAKTTDGGNTWTTVLTTPIANSYFWKISWPSTNIGYVALQQNASFDNIVFYKTTDGGNTWVSNAIPLTSVGLTTSQFYLQGLGFVSTNEGWIGGASGINYPNTFLHTVDGGATWTTAGFNDTYFINRIRFLNPTLGFAAGANVYVYHQPLTITTQPQSQVVWAGSNLNLSVLASGPAPISYQWQKNGSPIAATNPSLSFTNITRSVEGIYSVYVTNATTSLGSSNAIIRVLAAERLSAPKLLPGGQVQLLFNDADGGALLTTNDIPTFQVLVSTNLINWSVVTNALTITNGSLLMLDTWTNSPNRFYRVLEH